MNEPSPPPPDPLNTTTDNGPTYLEGLLAIIIVLAVIVTLSIMSIRSKASTENSGKQEKLYQLKTAIGKLRSDMTVSDLLLRAAREVRRVPHIDVLDRDSTRVGDHIDVRWTDAFRPPSDKTTYALQVTLIRPSSSATGIDYRWCEDQVYESQSSPPATGANGDEMLKPVSQCIFTASDSPHMTSRVPARADRKLPPGEYIWRVAEMSAPAAPKAQNSIADAESYDVSRIADWSNYGHFVLYNSSVSRLTAHHTVIVGVMSDQSSAFVRLSSLGMTGTEVEKAKCLVKCLRLNKNGVQSNCGSGSREENEAIPGEPLSAEIKEISDWGTWQAALRSREIDIAIGGITAASAREEPGVKFLTPAIQPVKSVMFLPAGGDSKETLRQWLRYPRRVGVVEGTSNAVYLHYIQEELCPELLKTPYIVGPHCLLTIMPKKDFPELDRELDKGGIDAIFTDNSLAAADVKGQNWTIRETSEFFQAKEKYQHEFLGRFEDESLSFAVMTDGSDRTLIDALTKARRSEVIKGEFAKIDHGALTCENIPR